MLQLKGGKLDKQLENEKKKMNESSSELTALKKENAVAEKRIAELEKQTKKLNDENRRLFADLSDEKAKVMALCEMREDDMEQDDPTPKKKSRRSSAKARKASLLPPEPEEETEEEEEDKSEEEELGGLFKVSSHKTDVRKQDLDSVDCSLWTVDHIQEYSPFRPKFLDARAPD